MDRGERHGVVVGLTGDDRADVERLLDRCNRHEGLDLPIFLEAPQAGGDAVTDFVFADQGTPIGFAWLPDDPEPEACLMVDPGHRRRGVGRALLDAVRTECRRRGLPTLLVVCDDASASARAFLAAVGARFRLAEYRLELDPTAIDRSRPRHDALHLRRAGADDVATLSRLQAAATGQRLEDARAHVTRGLGERGRRYYLAALSGEPIGLLRTGEWSGTADVTAFGVLPEHQGRGYGRQMLLDAVDLLLAEGHERIIIEVATDNPRALGLYRSCGFRVTTAYGFYELTP